MSPLGSTSRRPDRRSVPRLALAIVALASSSPAARPHPALAQDLPGAPSFEDVLSLESVGEVALSPDGTTVAFTVRATDWKDNRYDTEIWIAPADGDPHPLTRTPGGSSTSPA